MVFRYFFFVKSLKRNLMKVVFITMIMTLCNLDGQGEVMMEFIT